MTMMYRRIPSAHSVLLVLLLCVFYVALPTNAFFGFGSTAGGDRARGHEDSTVEEVDYYAVLGLSNDANERDVRQRFRQLSRKYHPDVKNTEEARKMYAQINRANEVLSDKRKRRMYDMRGEEGLRQLERAEARGGEDHEMDPFSRLFGASGGDGVKGQNSEVTLHVNLEAIYRGSRESFNLNKQKVCSKCKGSGAEKGTEMIRCAHCKGKGAVLHRLQFHPGMYQEVQQACSHCQGRGRVASQHCRACKGKKVLRDDVKLEIDIEQGIPEGHIVRFEMEADESPDVVPGDLVVHVHSKPHPHYTRRSNGLDLETKLTVTLKEALLGFKRRLKLLDGAEVIVEATGITPFGTVKKIRGKGMPQHNMPSERGDLYVEILFSFPTVLTESQRKDIMNHL